MIRPSCIVGLVAAATITHTVAALGTLVAVGTTGNDTILVRKGNGVPVSAIQSVPAGALQFQPTSFDQCVVTGNDTVKACADVQASWTSLTAGNAATGFSMAGTLTVSKSAIGDRAFARQIRALTFTIAGATLAEPYVLEIVGTRTSTLPVADAGLTCIVRNSANVILYSGPASGFSTVLSLGNGTYTVELVAQAELDVTDLPNNGSMDFALTLSTPELSCGSQFAGSCFVPNASPYCNDATCCEIVCAIDPSCCDAAWDATCVNQATVGCTTPSEITTRVLDPLTGRRYAIVDQAIWLAASTAVEAQGGRLATIESRAKQEWIERTISLVPPSFGVGSVWIGLTDAQHEGAKEGAFRWTSGLPLAFTNWAAGQPNADDPTDDYVALRLSDGRWFDRTGFEVERALAEFPVANCGGGGDCYAVHGPGCNDGTCCESVCAVDEFCCTTAWDASCVQLATQQCGVAGAPRVVAGPFINHATRTRYIITSMTSASIAERTAIELGGILAVPKDASENQWILANLANGALGAIPGWLGVHDQLVEGQFQTHLGLLVGYTGWDFQQPDNNGNADFIQMHPSPLPGFGGWRDTVHTQVAYGFVEIPCIGDFSGDGAIGPADLSILLGAWGGRDGDLDGDGATGPSDLSVLLGLWGECPTTNCCADHGGAGCDLPACAACVCALDPACCTTAWDAGCVALGASTACVATCQCDPAP
jgi:hypothetical protein